MSRRQTAPRAEGFGDGARTGRGTGLRLLVGLGVLVLLGGALVLAHRSSAAGSDSTAPAGSPNPAPLRPSTGADTSPARWRVLNTPMLRLPPAAAHPHTLVAHRDTTPILLPASTGAAQEPPRFPRTTAGAVATLRNLTESGMNGGDPRTYARAYRAVSAAGAPAPQRTVLGHALEVLHARLGPALGSGAVLLRFTVTDALLKGSTDDGSWVVVCVLGEVTISAGDRSGSVGLGDCQALSWTGRRWQISTGPLPAPAPCAWPGSAEAVRAGYREVLLR